MIASRIITCFALIATMPAMAAPTVDLPALARRTAPGPGQQALAPLVGRWRVEKRIFVAMGSPEKPALSNGMTTERHWVGNGRFLADTTTGAVAGRPYFRTGLLGYNVMERRYEWTTADNVTPILMSYRARAGSGVTRPIDMRGSFVDPGVLGEANVGKPVAMRTRIRIIDRDHHIFEIYFAPPGGREMLADRMIFTRIR